MEFIYIAGPYRAEHPYQVAANVRRARDVADEVALMGFFPIVPHTMTAHMDGIQDDKFWLDGTLELMDRAADIVVMLPGSAYSQGAREERTAALAKELPVYYWPYDKDLVATRCRGEEGHDNLRS